MKINKLIAVALVCALISSCNTNDKVRISLELDTELLPGGEVRLMELREDGFATVDTFRFVSNLKYQASIIPLKNTESFYRIDIPYNQYINVILTGEDKQIETKLFGRKKSVTGSLKSEKLLEIDNLLEQAVIRRTNMNNKARIFNREQQADSIVLLREEFDRSEMQLNSDLKTVIRDSNPSLVSLYGLNFLDMESEFLFFDSVVTSNLAKFPEHFWPKLLSSNLEKMRKLTKGQLAPDFTLNDPNGNPISLYQLRGKYVLIDFWAAWCRPCREENPNVVNAYKKYGGDNFEILGVSLDRTKEAWTKAIEEDGLPWLHVSDLQYFDSKAAKLYDINAIPATYLIDPEGRILDKNLRGTSLEEKLRELFDE